MNGEHGDPRILMEFVGMPDDDHRYFTHAATTKLGFQMRYL